MKLFNCILGVFVLFASVYCIFYPGMTFLNLGWVVAILLTCWGACALFESLVSRGEKKYGKRTLVKGIIALLLGITAFAGAILADVNVALTASVKIVLTYVFLFWLVVSGGINVGNAINSEDKKTSRRWIFRLILGAVSILVGIYGVCHALFAAATLSVAMGIVLAVYGIRLLVSVFE